MQKDRLAFRFLTIGLVLVFGWFGIDKFLHPLTWIGWMPTWMDGLMGMPKDTWLQVTGAIEIVLAAALLFPIRIIRRIASIGIILHLIAVITQIGINDIFVRDVGLLCAAVALALLL